MSDRNPKSEAEQVLESVKRLVAAAPPSVNRERVNASGGSTAVAGERLLLTPSLRVEEANDDAPLSDDAEQKLAQSFGDDGEAVTGPEATEDMDALTAEGHSLEDRIAELEAAVSTQPDEFEPDGSELVDRETPRRFVFQHTPVDLSPDPDPAPRQSLADRFEPVDDVEAGIAMAQTPEPDAPAVEMTPVLPVVESEPIPLRPDASAPDPFQPDPPDPSPGPEAVSVDAPAIEPNTLDVSDDIEIDEDMLRDIVADIVRSELQGELGERITRNVRKLVRREIHRAIMTRDFS